MKVVSAYGAYDKALFLELKLSSEEIEKISWSSLQKSPAMTATKRALDSVAVQSYVLTTFDTDKSDTAEMCVHGKLGDDKLFVEIYNEHTVENSLLKTLLPSPNRFKQPAQALQLLPETMLESVDKFIDILIAYGYDGDISNLDFIYAQPCIVFSDEVSDNLRLALMDYGKWITVEQDPEGDEYQWQNFRKPKDYTRKRVTALRAYFENLKDCTKKSILHKLISRIKP